MNEHRRAANCGDEAPSASLETERTTTNKLDWTTWSKLKKSAVDVNHRLTLTPSNAERTRLLTEASRDSTSRAGQTHGEGSGGGRLDGGSPPGWTPSGIDLPGVADKNKLYLFAFTSQKAGPKLPPRHRRRPRRCRRTLATYRFCPEERKHFRGRLRWISSLTSNHSFLQSNTLDSSSSSFFSFFAIRLILVFPGEQHVVAASRCCLSCDSDSDGSSRVKWRVPPPLSWEENEEQLLCCRGRLSSAAFDGTAFSPMVRLSL
ncbi:unnamed protein product [Pleuronectes platessa]|uniref:Uncharacterized protein n=1 Tax=Pleuronectes platessa TaxID=8262 RepID=A0A9N7TVE3_PLEPL|nr:unnamed protein product [Pleuronectes platessa]